MIPAPADRIDPAPLTPKKRRVRLQLEGLVQGVTGKTPKWNETNPAWDEVFLTYHPNGDYPYGSSQWFHADAWLDANGVIFVLIQAAAILTLISMLHGINSTKE